MASNDSLMPPTITAAESDTVTSNAATTDPSRRHQTQDGGKTSETVSGKPGVPCRTTPAPCTTNISAPLPGYRLVKIRKEDGTIATVMRKMTPEELETGGERKSVQTVPKEGIQYKIVTVRHTDGSLMRVKRPIKPTEPIPSASITAPHSLSTNEGRHALNYPETISEYLAQSNSAPTVTASSTVHKPVELETSKLDEPAAEMLVTDSDLIAQKEHFREQRMKKFKQTLIQGVGTILGPSVHHMDFGDGHGSYYDIGGNVDSIQDGDIIDSDEDWSDDDFDGAYNHNHHYIDGDSTQPSSLESNMHAATIEASKSLIFGAAATAAGAAGKPEKPIVAGAPRFIHKSSEDSSSKDKMTYKITLAELENSEKQSAEKDLERPLRRHWTNLTFYLMASLSIFLPLLFLLLAIFIFQMHGQPVNPNWSAMPDIIKLGVSAWPIVFAAVVAQVFKGYATWRVERGIKLMKLEQLLGSYSFGNAIKQPMILRRLNFLGMVLVVTWCLSPFGSQALQRTYTLKPFEQTENTTVYYVDQLRNNQVFSYNWSDSISITTHAAHNQFVALQFLATLLPVDEMSADEWASSDSYKNPIMFKLNRTDAVAGMGLPIALPKPVIDQRATTSHLFEPSEKIDFSVNSSYFEFHCTDWTIQQRSELGTDYEWSASGTMGLKFSKRNSSFVNHAAFASANINTEIQGGDELANVTYSQIDCDFEQIYTNAKITCQRTIPDGNTTARNIDRQCWESSGSPLSAERYAGDNYGTMLEDFADDWTHMGALVNPNRNGNYSTPTELYLMAGHKYMTHSGYTAESMNLTSNHDSGYFATHFGYLFNTWVGLGYCPECQAIMDADEIKDRSEVRYQFPMDNLFYRLHNFLLIAGIVTVVVESITIAPDTLGYVSTVARNSRYLHLKPTSGAMTGPERARKLAETEVMMQDVRANADVGKIALGMKTEKSAKLRYDRLYR